MFRLVLVAKRLVERLVVHHPLDRVGAVAVIDDLARRPFGVVGCETARLQPVLIGEPAAALYIGIPLVVSIVLADVPHAVGMFLHRIGVKRRSPP